MKHVNGLFSLFAAACLVAGSVHAADPAPVVLTDAEMLGVLAIANGAEVSSGEVAVTKGQKQEVKDFGTKMVADHTASNLKIEAVELKSGIKRAESEMSRQLKTDTDKMIDDLKSAKDVDFDRNYIDNQVMIHQQLLDKLDNEFLPNVKNSDIKDLLTETRTAVETHLNDALKIQQDLVQP